ncbi:MAG: SDR family NAD(P)-dependent oxidoreductase [Actinomycetota bacterium]|nr:SDR family NAD(P)-dependent oxidoreductase [Actinomycetota bacterium]
MESVQGRGAVITGGASGIGFETARRLADQGAKVVLADIEKAALDGAVEQLRATGAEAHGVVCDVASLESVTALADEAFRLLGKVHIVFNNAGIGVGGPIAEMTHDDWRWTIDVDLWGPIHGVEAFLNRIIDQGEGGHILFTSSFAGLVPNVGLGPYCVAKYGVVALAEVLQREMREHEIGVSVVCPMRAATNIDDSARNRTPEYGAPESAHLPTEDEVEEQNYLGRTLPVEEVGRLTVEAILANELYVLTHHEARGPVRRRFERIDRAFARVPGADTA